MKKTISFLFALLLCISAVFAVSCSKKQNISDGKIKVLATVFPPYDFARQIGKDEIDVDILVKPGNESHSFELTLEDISKINKCDIFIYGGGESDEWVDDVFENNPSLKEKSYSMLGILEEANTELLYNGEMHNGEKEIDEHVWTSVKNAKVIVGKICDLLCEKSPENAEKFSENKNIYMSLLDELDKDYSELSEQYKGRKIVFEGRFPFRYLFSDYGFEYTAVIDGCSSNTEVSLADLDILKKEVEKSDKPFICHTEFSDCKNSDFIVGATGCKTVYFHSCHSLTEEEANNKETYYSLNKRNIEQLREVLD